MTAGIIWLVCFILGLWGIILAFKANTGNAMNILAGIVCLVFPVLGLIVAIYHIATKENLVEWIFKKEEVSEQ